MRIFLILLVLSISMTSQNIQSINNWTWSDNHLKQEPERWNRYDYKNYMSRYYVSPTISFSLRLKYMGPNNYFFYREKKRIYKFIF